MGKECPFSCPFVGLLDDEYEVPNRVGVFALPTDLLSVVSSCLFLPLFLDEGSIDLGLLVDDQIYSKS